MSASTPQHSLQLRLLGTHGSSTSYGLRDFLYRSNVSFEWIELTSDQQARELAQVNDLHDHRLPVCLFPDGGRLDNPTIRQIAEKLGWFQKPSSAEYDLAILGGGPAGLSAAVYGASEGLKTLLIERYAVGGQAGTSSRIENYLGFPQGISGSDLAKRARDQADRFGAEILLLHEGVRAELVPGKLIGHLADGTSFVMRAAICASGVEYRRLNLWNEERLRGAGVFYGAGTSEAELCSSQEVFVVGGGNSAGQAAIHFSRYARRVYILIRGDGLKETLSQYLIDRISASPKIEVRGHTEVVELHGDNHLEAITLIDNLTGGRKRSTRAGFSYASAVFPTRTGPQKPAWCATNNVISLPVRIYDSTVALPGHGRSIANPTIWKPAFPECSPPAMFAMAP